MPRIIQSLDPFLDVKEETAGFLYKLRRRIFASSSRGAAWYFGVLAAWGLKPLVSERGGPVVTLTSYGARVNQVVKTIESIGRGRVRPSRIILWIDDEEIFNELPAGVSRQIRRGLEVRLAENLGPHTKYYPLVSDETWVPGVFVTADDDILYPRWWLDRLRQGHRQNPNNVICYRAHRIVVSGSAIAPYEEWPSVRSTDASPTVFATGVSGVLYPVAMAHALRAEGEGFRGCSQSTDDVWLHRVALSTGITARQVATFPRHFWLTPDSQATTLMDQNLTGGNDRAIERSYDQRHVRLLGSVRAGGDRGQTESE